nr:hypothetical protein [uncultured bacterium]
MKLAPVIDDKDVAPPPFVELWGAEFHAVLEKPQGRATALVNRVNTTRIKPKKGAVRRKECGIEGSTAGSDENWSVFKKMQLLGRESKLSPLEKFRNGPARPRLDAPQQEISARSRSMTEFDVERQFVQSISRTQGSRVRVLKTLGPDHFLKGACSPACALPEKRSESANYVEHSFGVRVVRGILGPAALCQRGQKRRCSCGNSVSLHHSGQANSCSGHHASIALEAGLQREPT